MSTVDSIYGGCEEGMFGPYVAGTERSIGSCPARGLRPVLPTYWRSSISNNNT